MVSLRAAAKLYDGMASLDEARLEAGRAPAMRAAVQKSLGEFQSARASLREALDLLPQTVAYLESHWDEAYEALLRTSGFKGSLFILREWRIHLETIERAAAGQVDINETSLQRMASATPPQVTPLTTLLESSTTRGLCRALIRFLDFEDASAQTQVVNISRVAAERAQPG